GTLREPGGRRGPASQRARGRPPRGALRGDGGDAARERRGPRPGPQARVRVEGPGRRGQLHGQRRRASPPLPARDRPVRRRGGRPAGRPADLPRPQPAGAPRAPPPRPPAPRAHPPPPPPPPPP